MSDTAPRPTSTPAPATGGTARLSELRIERGEEPARRRGWLWALPAIALLAAGAWWLLRPRPPEVKTATVAAAPVAAGGAATVLDASGYVVARRQATVSSKVTGRVVEVLVEEGMQVAEGQLLARLDAATPGAAERLAASQVAAASSALEETRVRIAEAKLELGRQESLAAQGFTSQAELDRARAQVQALEARLAAQRDELGVAERALALRRQDVTDTEIRAPFAGVVVSKNAQPGEMISPMSAGGGFTRTGICTLVDMASLEIEVDVNEAYINRVRAGQPVEATLDAYPDWKIPAHVITIVPTADRQKATVRVRIAIDGKDPRILPDMGVKVSFVAPAAEAGAAPVAREVLVPRTAVRRDGEQDVVLVVADGRVERRAVQVGRTRGDTVHVAAGVAAGETVVVEGPTDLADGAAVRPVASAPQ
jgi:RND family efflux transporter MFP subunit